MKVVILAGGYGTRISEESDHKPKPMIEIGNKPIIWHIMKLFSHYGHNDFIILLGYKGYYFKEYFANYFLHQSNVTFDLVDNKMEIHDHTCEPWKVTLIETGLDTMTAGRILRAQKYIGNNSFLLTYGDGVADINIDELVSFHKEHQKTVTVTAVQPEGRFGILSIVDNNQVSCFIEKPKGDDAWINAGFLVCESKIFKYITEGDSTILERQPLEKLAQENSLFAYKYHGFWKCMDTLRDKNQLEEMWKSNNAKWKIWE